MIDLKQFIPEGKENKVSAAHLVRVLGLRNERELRRAIRSARLTGELVLSTRGEGGGYYYPSCREEIEEFVGSLSQEGIALFRTIKTARQALSLLDGQEEGRNG